VQAPSCDCSDNVRPDSLALAQGDRVGALIAFSGTTGA